ncbi:MAG: GNAT family N-acetyltransferase [Bacteroidales bacterium]|nr:GNAT family N-acetyltransferase [Clostridium sp.]MCM1203857.1 GNAT family N-acetyltransferase [Bacteroidales bacterium]
MQAYTEAVKCRRKFSNCYFSVQELQDKWQRQKITAYEAEETLLLVEKEERLNSLYYLSSSWDWFLYGEEIKEKYQPLVLSLVQRTESVEELPFLDKGYAVYKTYQRLRRTENPLCRETGETDYCAEKDRGRLREMMDNTFDVFSDHIPTDEELDIWIKNDNIICMRIDGTVVGFIIFEDKGKTSYIRMVCIDREHRGNGMGNRLMDIYFRIHQDYKSFTLWYDMQNTAAYALYHRWGYEKENMYNLIFVL